jgi:hypothetical protein
MGEYWTNDEIARARRVARRASGLAEEVYTYLLRYDALPTLGRCCLEATRGLTEAAVNLQGGAEISERFQSTEETDDDTSPGS